MSELNNAQIACINRVAIYDYEIVDAEQQIWKGKPVLVKGAPVVEDAIVFFSRRYRDDSDMDKMLEEYEMKNESLIGVKFLLVPREKLLFGYTPPSTIIRPDMNLRRT